MFTIKHIDKNNTERLIEANGVWYEDNTEDVIGTDQPVIKQLTYTTGALVEGGHLVRMIDYGTVYVMNYNGKTIANYSLGSGD